MRGCMLNITATEIREREEAYWRNYKPSKEYLDAEERVLKPVLDKIHEIITDTKGIECQSTYVRLLP